MRPSAVITSIFSGKAAVRANGVWRGELDDNTYCRQKFARTFRGREQGARGINFHLQAQWWQVWLEEKRSDASKTASDQPGCDTYTALHLGNAWQGCSWRRLKVVIVNSETPTFPLGTPFQIQVMASYFVHLPQPHSSWRLLRTLDGCCFSSLAVISTS